ncbi:hypothetical protein [Streptomyces flavalbus]|uniref:Uncharacterized protein n=1 Tax=Streptomyces flavalbus TaxID=2665155 RepID=A0ABW2W0C5_9ACTN
MAESSTSALLQGTVLDLATDVVSALRSGDHARAGSTPPPPGGASEALARAAVRVLGADTLLPSVLLPLPPDPARLTLFEQAVAAHPPGADAAPTVVWSHWAMTRTLRRLGRSPDGTDGAVDREPDASWLADATWQHLTHQLAVLAPLALPGEDCAVARAARRRPVDVARGFVRAVRRRDWRQAAGAGRWLTLLDGVPDTLGLAAGLDFVRLMGGDDPRVALQLEAARLLHVPAGVLR